MVADTAPEVGALPDGVPDGPASPGGRRREALVVGLLDGFEPYRASKDAARPRAADVCNQ